MNFTNKIFSILKSQLYTLSLYCRQLAGTLSVLLIARYLAVYDFGLFSSYKSISSFCLLFANLDFDHYILVSSKANMHDVKLKVSLLITNAIFLILLVSTGSLLLGLENHILFILVLLRTFFDTTFFSLVLPHFQASGKFMKISKINISYGICISLIAIISYIFKFSLTKFLILSICAGTINFIQCTFFSKINFVMPFVYLKRFIQKIDKQIFTYIASSITSYLYAQLSALYVAVFLPKEQAALFFAANTIAMFPTLFTAAQVQKMLPELIKTSPVNHSKIIRKNITILVSFFILIFIFFTFLGKWLLKLIYLKDYYLNAHVILLLLMLAYTFIGISTIYGAHITAAGKQIVKVKVKVEASVITVISLISLYKFGISGAAMSVAVSGFYTALRYALWSIKIRKNLQEVKTNE